MKFHQSPRAENQFPQPIRPINSYDMNCLICPQPTNGVDPIINENNDSISEWQEKLPQQYPNDLAQAKTTTTMVLEEEAGEEALEKLIRSMFLEAYEKLPERIRHQFNMEGLIRQISAQKGSKVDITCSSRGLEGFDQMEDFAQKLERFKIRTLDPNGGTIVKEDMKK
ncbi:hypothetical protein PanWU01x14_329170 [Parasponia andersonii]|uniref:Uncharacterized protein n=1 Tax=Parasponia andersonii TaxID=3476 RepID=A0A2P5AIK3_PARAD|nr:hypothetical protein PanWU01x14_329170 [Parasponia andersonii]